MNQRISRRAALQFLGYGAFASMVGCSAANSPALVPTMPPIVAPAPLLPAVTPTAIPTPTTAATPTSVLGPSQTSAPQVIENTQSAFVEVTSQASASPVSAMPNRPDRVFGLHLPFYWFESPIDYAALEAELVSTGANCLVIDIKSEWGSVAVPFNHALRPPYLDTLGIDYGQASTLVEWLNQRGVYPIARQVVMSDSPMVAQHPNLALRYSGRQYVDVSGELWLDPELAEVGEYNAAVALACVQAGFREVQLDYVRYPEADFSMSIERRVSAIYNIAARIKAELNGQAHLTLDLLGDSTSNYPEELSDAGVGQHIATLGTIADGICPMLYPDLRSQNINVDYYQYVFDATTRAKQRITQGGESAFLTPWIQAYYAAGRDRIIEQTQAAFDAGAIGVYGWNRDLNYPNNTFG